MNLSPHFTLFEAMRSQIASRFNIDNTPPDDVIPKLRLVALNILEPIREHFGISFMPTSWYRNPTVNRMAGGAQSPVSQHTKGEAVDIELHGISNRDLGKWVEQNLKFDQLILEFWDGKNPSSGWVHVSYVDYRPLRQMAGVFFNRSYKWEGIP